MGVSTKEEYADKIAYTETLRKKIRELEKQASNVRAYLCMLIFF